MHNILVTGANGQLGREMRLLGATSLTNCYHYTGRAELDITDERAVRKFVGDHHIDILVNCAAYTQVDRAESNREEAQRINSDAVGLLARVVAEADATLFHISTDYVFDGEATAPYAETDTPHPTTVYGATKRQGEVLIEQTGCKSLIIRASWLYSEYGNNFLKTMLRLTAERDKVQVVSDQTGTPTYARDLACLLFGLIEQEHYIGHEGLYHFSNEGACTWYDFACAIVREAHRTDCRVVPCCTVAYPSVAQRPAYSVLDKSKIKQTFGIDIPYWETSLQQCINRLQAEEN
jgi:dTDP-4-dehydrorhamnose reductase